MLTTTVSTSAAWQGCGGASRKATTANGQDDPGRAVGSHPDGAAIAVWAVPGASRTGFTGMHGDAVRIRVAAAPERGKANAEIAAVLRTLVGAAAVDLESGLNSRRKRFVALGVSRDQAVRRIGNAIREQSDGASR